MLSLTPAKLLVLLVVALIVLGPEKLPQVARQLGAAWGELRRFRARLESDVRGAFPDLPPTHEVAQAVRSPLAFLDRLADEHEKSKTAATGEVGDGAGAPTATGPPGATSNGNGVNGDGPSANGASGNGASGNGASGNGASGNGAHRAPDFDELHAVVPDDPSMN